MRKIPPKWTKRLAIVLAVLIIIPPIVGWISRGFIERTTEQLASEIDATYSSEMEFGWFNSIVKTHLEFSPSVIQIDGKSVAEDFLGQEPVILDLTHELYHGPLLFSRKPFHWLQPYFGPILVNTAVVVDNSKNARFPKLLGDYLTAKTAFSGINELSTRIKPGRKQFSIDNVAPISILSPEIVIERTLIPQKYDAFLSISKAQIHNEEFASPIFDNVAIRMRPLTRQVTPDEQSNVIITAEQIRTERILLKNVRVNSLMRPLSETTAGVHWSINVASIVNDMVSVAESVGANLTVMGLTKDSIRPITKKINAANLHDLAVASISQPFNVKGYISANTTAGPMNLSIDVNHKPGTSMPSDNALMRLMEQISGTAQLDMSDDAFLLAQLALNRVTLDEESNQGIKHSNGKSSISINIENGVAQIGNLYFDIPALTLL